MEQEDLFLSVYRDYREHARHSESTRESANNFMLAISAAIISVMTHDKKLCPSDISLALSLIFLGIFGLLSSVTYTARYQHNRMRASEIRSALDKWYNDGKKAGLGTIEGIETTADQKQKDILSKIFSRRGLFGQNDVVKNSIKDGGHHLVWFLFPSVLIVVGIILTVLAILGNPEC